MRNDSVNNLLCSLIIAGLYAIPEVLVVFNNKILRGNRSTKTSASSFNSFQSPNSYPLGTLDLKITINWEMVRPYIADKPTLFHEITEQVMLIKLTPFGFQPPP